MAQDLTNALQQGSKGDGTALDAVFIEVYDELRRHARRLLASERAGTLQPTSMVNDLYLKLIATERCDWRDRAHFVAIGVRALRQLLVEHARERDAIKRGRDYERVALTGLELFGPDRGDVPIDLIDLEEVLAALDRENTEHGRLAELRLYGGLTLSEIAEVLNTNLTRIERHWRFVKRWLQVRLEADHD